MTEIKNSTEADIDLIYTFYGYAAAHQRGIKTVTVWPDFEREMVLREIREGHQWQLLVDAKVVCVWATTHSDPQIWEERNADAAVYIHRIATHPDYRGNNCVGTIVEWAKEYARANDLRYVRLDTLGNNVRLIKHYTDMGFDFLGMEKLADYTGLPLHYQDGLVCRFELGV